MKINKNKSLFMIAFGLLLYLIIFYGFRINIDFFCYFIVYLVSCLMTGGFTGEWGF